MKKPTLFESLSPLLFFAMLASLASFIYGIAEYHNTLMIIGGTSCLCVIIVTVIVCYLDEKR
jgi:hypothetical protein